MTGKTIIIGIKVAGIDKTITIGNAISMIDQLVTNGTDDLTTYKV